MTSEPFKATAFIKDGCPFSFKFLVFATETGLLDELEVVRVRDGDPGTEATKQKLSEKLGKQVSFPTVEIEPDRYLADSDKLIEHYAQQMKVAADDLPVLSFYKQTILPKLFEHYKLTSARKG
jgi:hypothetical protein